jgi:hypothetical protein
MQSRDEMLFWKMIDLYSEAWDGGVAHCSDKDGKIGLLYTGFGSNSVSPLLELTFCVTGTGVNVKIYAYYDILSDSAEKEKYNSRMPEYSTVDEKFFVWEMFEFDRLINWIAERGEYEEAVKKYQERYLLSKA